MHVRRPEFGKRCSQVTGRHHFSFQRSLARVRLTQPQTCVFDGMSGKPAASGIFQQLCFRVIEQNRCRIHRQLLHRLVDEHAQRDRQVNARRNRHVHRAQRCQVLHLSFNLILGLLALGNILDTDKYSGITLAVSRNIGGD